MEILNCVYQKVKQGLISGARGPRNPQYSELACVRRPGTRFLEPRLPKVFKPNPITQHPQRHSEASATLSRLSTPAPTNGPNSLPGILSFFPFSIHSPRCAGQKFQNGRITFPFFRGAAKQTASSPIQRPTRFKFVHFRLQSGRCAELRPLWGGAHGNAGCGGRTKHARLLSGVRAPLCCEIFGVFCLCSYFTGYRKVQVQSWCFCPVTLERILLFLKWTEMR